MVVMATMAVVVMMTVLIAMVVSMVTMAEDAIFVPVLSEEKVLISSSLYKLL